MTFAEFSRWLFPFSRKNDDWRKDVFPLWSSGVTYQQQKNFDDARRSFLNALKQRERIDDANVVGFLLDGLGSSWFIEGRFDESMRFFTEYIVKYPNDSAAYYQRGTALWYLGRLAEAVADFTKALDLNPSNQFIYASRGQVLMEAGENEKAIQDLDRAVQVLCDNPFIKSLAYARNGRASAYAGLGEMERAHKEFEISILLSPDNAWVYFNRAQMFDRLGNREKAIADYECSLEKKDPSLNPVKRERAAARLRELQEA